MERVVACWLQSYHADFTYAGALKQLPPEEAEPYQLRQNRASREVRHGKPEPMGRRRMMARDRRKAEPPAPRVGTFYHFTCFAHVDEILQARALLPSESNFSFKRVNARPPCVWLLDVAEPGEYSHGLLTGTVDPETGERKVTVDPPPEFDKRGVRFTVLYPAIPWLPWAKHEGIDSRTFSGMLGVGGGYAAARHWYCRFGTISSAHWIAVDIRRDVATRLGMADDPDEPPPEGPWRRLLVPSSG